MNMSTHDLSNVKANTEKQGKGEITLEKIKHQLQCTKNKTVCKPRK